MALLKCPECNNWVGEKMSKCPHCGLSREKIDGVIIENEEIKTNKVQTGKKMSLEKIIISIIIIIFTIAILASYSEYNNSKEKTYDENDYAVISEYIIDKRLKAPSTADYSTISVKKSNSDVITSGYVDADNSFGAKIRTYFTITFYGGDLDNYSVVIN